MEVTKAYRKMVASLATPKGRREHGLFVAEGTKCVIDTLTTFKPEVILATGAWLNRHCNHLAPSFDVIEVKRSDLIEMSSLSTPPDVIALYPIPRHEAIDPTPGELYLALDRVQDPGNLGTIIRICSWMGISRIYCSPDTVDVYNPKVVQSTMGALSTVKVEYRDLPLLLSESARKGIGIYGTFLDGQNIYSTQLSSGGIIVMGNEGRGISHETEQTITHRLYIPPYPADATHVESLNVSVATAITVAEFRRQATLNHMIK